ncbi:MAG: hypothetical protein GW893_12790 [Armatimonadetes bacterium]|nr:hypothetical protein [Armatimonadota bacterium]PIU65154.1 MAG: hypothetical protein COS85_09875 [Armatimonadetes bacterium CG07_land_8_20_14_0_80_59_28]PIX45257.1 MAG: hypothetical protein COZ56_02255 [Armatimonadetes bacterium CG_4_8_14_3_um_filter_58_9]PIY38118.1 MAG: hypothetical protein COZ05_21300 [Armatimonadetes bacterium CG_4_10_14_3_um_filter_59_10]
MEGDLRLGKEATATGQTAAAAQEAVRWIASLGGFLGRKRDGEPGTTTMRRGLERLAALVEGWQLYQTMHPARASP